MGKFKWPTGSQTPHPKPKTAPEEEVKQVDMTKFIPKPKTIEALKWDGSPEGAAEVKTLLEKAGFTMDSFVVSYTADGKLDKHSSVIKYYRTDKVDGRPRDDDRYAWNTYSLNDGWLVLEGTSRSDLKTVSNSLFKDKYVELGQVTYDDFIEWFSEAT